MTYVSLNLIGTPVADSAEVPIDLEFQVIHMHARLPLRARYEHTYNGDESFSLNGGVLHCRRPFGKTRRPQYSVPAATGIYS